MDNSIMDFYIQGIPSNQIKNELYHQFDVKKGLRNEDGTGVRVGLTCIGDVVGYTMENGQKREAKGELYYRGIELRELIQEAHFEEICFLLLFGYLPNAKQYDCFCHILRSHYALPHDFLQTHFLQMPGKNIMNRIQQAVLGLYDYDEKAEDPSIENNLIQGINILAKLPSIIVYAYQSKKYKYNHESLVIHPVQESLSIAENILYMLRKDHQYSALEASLLERLLLVHAEHGGGNNSTFTSVVIASTGTDLYSALVGAIGSMKGARHGGANLKVCEMMKEVIEKIGYSEDEDQIKEVLHLILHKQFYDGSGLIYGMGHAVYTLSDPRSEVLQNSIQALANEKHKEKEYAFYQRFEKCAREVIAKEKGIHVSSNVDFYSGFVYEMLEIPQELFTPLFVLARMVGWLAHTIENKIYDGRIVRPATKYVGKINHYVSMKERK